MIPGPHETLEIDLDADTVARLAIQIVRAPAIPTPNELTTRHIPTARELDPVARLLSQRKHRFPPLP